MSKPTPDDLRKWADNPAASGMTPVHPETLRWLAKQVETLTAKVDEAWDAEVALGMKLGTAESWVADLQSGMYVNCVYCGHRYGPGETTPVSMADALKAHVETCCKHPMSQLRAELAACTSLLAEQQQRLFYRDGELWSFLRSVMTQGQDIAIDYRERGYEEMSARLDEAARERVDKLVDLTAAVVNPGLDPPSLESLTPDLGEREKLKRALELLSQYYWAQSRAQGRRVDETVHDFFTEIGDEWRTKSLHRSHP